MLQYKSKGAPNTSNQLPIDLIQVFGLEHHTADDALTRGRLHYDGDDAPENVEVGPHSGRVPLLRDCECRAIITPVDIATGGVPHLFIHLTTTGPVEGDVGAERRIGRTVISLHGVAISERLGEGRGGESREGGEGEGASETHFGNISRRTRNEN